MARRIGGPGRGCAAVPDWVLHFQWTPAASAAEVTEDFMWRQLRARREWMTASGAWLAANAPHLTRQELAAEAARR